MPVLDPETGLAAVFSKAAVFLTAFVLRFEVCSAGPTSGAVASSNFSASPLAWSASDSAIADSAMSGRAQSMLRLLPLKLTTTAVTESPIFIIDFALRGVGSPIIRSGM